MDSDNIQVTNHACIVDGWKNHWAQFVDQDDWSRTTDISLVGKLRWK